MEKRMDYVKELKKLERKNPADYPSLKRLQQWQKDWDEFAFREIVAWLCCRAQVGYSFEEAVRTIEAHYKDGDISRHFADEIRGYVGQYYKVLAQI